MAKDGKRSILGGGDRIWLCKTFRGSRDMEACIWGGYEVRVPEGRIEGGCWAGARMKHPMQSSGEKTNE